jgi:hypothetical protein
MKIVGQLVCGPGEADRYLKETLEEFKRLCDDVVVVLCNAGPKEKAMVRSYDFRSYEDNREWGREQPNIKTKLLKTILKLEPDWILPLDADETMPGMTRPFLESLTERRESCFFYVVNLWNDPGHYSKALSFWNVRFYKADESKGTQFLRKPVHCGNAPPYFYKQPAKKAYVPHILLHKGLMLREDRLKKAARYDLYDPAAIHKGRDYYDALIAVGPGTVYNQDEVELKIQNFYATLR